MDRRTFLKRAVAAGVGVSLSGWLAGCGGAATPAAPTAAPQAPAAPAKVSGPLPPAVEALPEAERAAYMQVVEAARKEGKFNMIGIMVEPEHAVVILNEFKKRYGLENLDAQYVYSQSGELIAKIEELLKAKKNDVDVVWTSSYAWYLDLKERGEILQYESRWYKDYTLSDKYMMSQPGYWVSDAYSFHPMYNPDALEKAGIKGFKPTSWWDFVDPKLKGLVSCGNPLKSTSYAGMAQGWTKEPELGVKYFEAVGKLQPSLYDKSAQGRDMVASGEFPITLTSHAKNAMTIKEKKVSVALSYPKEGIALLPFAPIILKAAPHPNVSKLFIDFTRSPEGPPTILKAGTILFFGRPGVKSPDPELLPPLENIRVSTIDWNQESSEEAIQKVRAIWKQAGLN